MKLDHSLFADSTNDATGASTLAFASAETLEGRAKNGEIAAAFNSLMACSGVDGQDSAAELRRVYFAMLDAARRAEWQAKRDKRQPTQARAFRAASWRIELHIRRETLPDDLTPEEFKRRTSSLARAFRRRWAVVHDFQCRSGFAFIEKVAGDFKEHRREASWFVERVSDLITATVGLTKKKGSTNPVERSMNAAQTALAAFSLQYPAYAPEYQEQADEPAADTTTEEEKPDPLKWISDLEGGTRKLARIARAQAREHEMSEDEETDLRFKLIQAIEDEWGKAPPPKGGKSPNVYAVPAESIQGGQAKASVGAQAGISAELKNEEAKMSSKNEDSGELDRTNLSAIDEAVRAVETWESIGADSFLILMLDETKATTDPARRAYSKVMTGADLKRQMSYFLKRNEARPESLLIRPTITHKHVNRIIHLDDSDLDQHIKMERFCFFQELTSAGNGQAFIALNSALPDEAFDTLRNRLLDGLNPARDKSKVNKGSSGCTRWPGSLNKKPERKAPDGSYPRIQLVAVAPARTVAPLELERAGLLAPAPQPKPKPVAAPVNLNLPGGWPDFQDYLSRKWVQDKNRPDRSSAEIAWACAAYRMGWPRPSIIAELGRISLKAQGRRDNYVADTVDAAITFIDSQPAQDYIRPGRERIAI
jgi:hypothetical protein